jgi:hypothetical protein
MRTIVLSSSLIAFSIACGYAKLLLFPYLFFVELFTVAVFVSGMLAGVGWGLWIGALARLTFSVANPYGPPHPWVLAAQVAGAAIAGALGGLAGPILLRSGESSAAFRARAGILAALGLAATLLYDALTNLAQAVAFGSIQLSVALGIVPAIQHSASNVLLFALMGTFAVPWLRRHPVAARHGR